MRISDWSSDVCSSDLARDVAKVHYCVATHLDREVDDVLHGLEHAGYLHREEALPGIERAGGDHQVGLGTHLHDVGGVAAVAIQSDGNDADLEKIVAVADNLCLQHAGHTHAPTPKSAAQAHRGGITKAPG